MGSIVPTSFFLKIKFNTLTDIWGVVTYYGFERPSTLYLRYMVVLNTFPDIYISDVLDVSNFTYSISIGGSRELIFSVNSLSNTVILPLSADTVFIHSLTYFHLTSLKAFLDSSF